MSRSKKRQTSRVRRNAGGPGARQLTPKASVARTVAVGPAGELGAQRENEQAPGLGGAPPAWRRELSLAFVLVAAACLVAFWPTFSNGWVSFDDPRYVVDNAAVQQGLSLETLQWAFTSRHAYNWHPLTWLSHALDFDLFGRRWGGHHGTSLLLHAIAAVLLFGFLRSVRIGRGVALAVVLLFAVHPLRVESVAWLSERKDTLSTALFFGTLWAYVSWVQRGGVGRWILWFGLALLGLLAKPMLVTLPFLLVLVDLWPLARVRLLGWGGPGGGSVTWTRIVIEKLPLLAVVCGSVGATLWAQQPIVQDLEQYPLPSRLGNAVVSLVRYVGQLVWPSDLGVFYPHPGAVGWPLVAVAGASGLVAVATASAWRLRRAQPWWLAGWFWFLGMLIPVIGVVQVGLQSMADRYTYLPTVGLVLAAALGVEHWVAGVSTARRAVRVRTVTLTTLILVLILSVRTHQQTRHWLNDVTLLEQTLRATNGSFWAHYNLGLVHQREGRRDAAKVQFERALEFESDNVETLRNLGHLEDGERAAELFERALVLRPTDPFAQIDVARSREAQGDYEGSLVVVTAALEQRPREPSWLALQGRVLVQMRRYAEAEGPLRAAAELVPDEAESWNALGVALAQQQRFSEAVPLFQRALAVDPQHAEAGRNLEAARRLSGG